MRITSVVLLALFSVCDGAFAGWQVMPPQIRIIDLPDRCFLISREDWELSPGRKTTHRATAIDHELFFAAQPLVKGGRFRFIEKVYDRGDLPVSKFKVESLDTTDPRLKHLMVYGTTDRWYFGSPSVEDLGTCFDVTCWVP